MHTIDIIALATLTFLVGFFGGRLLLVYQLNKEIEKFGSLKEKPTDYLHEPNDKEAILEEHIAKCIVEKVDNTYFLYEQETQRYMAHATSIDELAKFAQKNSEVDYALVSFNDSNTTDLFWFHHGEVNKL